MTKFHYEEVVCPNCLNEEKIAVWDIVNVSEDPDLKEKIYLKELQNFECQNCNHKYILDQAFLYIDPDKKLLFYYAPKYADLLTQPESRTKLGTLKPEILDNLPLDFGFDLKGYNLQIILHYNELIEKLHIFDFDLDDRIIEIIKIAIKLNPPVFPAPDEAVPVESTMSKQNEQDQDNKAKAIISLYFLGIENNEYIFQVLNADNSWNQIVLEPTVYQNTKNLLSQYISSDKSKPSGWQIIDAQTASLFLNELELI